MSIVPLLCRFTGTCKLRAVQFCGVRNYAIRTGSGAAVAVECLGDRGILRVSGKEVSAFLQGLITNDMRHFEEGAVSMYTVFLNTRGRVLCDSIIYKAEEGNLFFIECDTKFIPLLQKHLKVFRVRKKIDIDSMGNLLNVWVVYNPDVAVCSYTADYQNSEQSIFTETVKKYFSDSAAIASRDPRLPALGVRVLYPADLKPENINSQLDQIPTENKISYRMLRYRLGIGEGIDDFPPEKCLPLEINCDYLHGVSFHKGCYIGQELTARTHHTGVVRKRIMPLIFDLIPKDGFVPDMPILSMTSHNVIGKLRAVEKDTGLGMLRIAEALECCMFQISDGTCHTYKPTWWPQTLPKDRVSLKK